MWKIWINFIPGAELILTGLVSPIRTEASTIIGGALAVLFGMVLSSVKSSYAVLNILIGVIVVLSGLMMHPVQQWDLYTFGSLLIVITYAALTFGKNTKLAH